MSSPNYYVHPSSVVDPGAVIGQGTKIWHFSHISSKARIGENCKIGQNVFIGDNVIVGNNVKIQNNVSVYEGVILEDDVFCGPSMVFTNVINPRSAFPRNTPEHFGKTHIKKGASIGANATVICGVTLGAHSFIGAGAVITKDIPDFALAYGNPARLRGWMCDCGGKVSWHHKKLSCKECQKKYIAGKEKIKPQHD